MFFDEIIHGTQYYRAPTPLPEEWEGDIAKLADYNLDTMQIRINWRWNEKREGEYDFSDVDRLMELAEKYNRKVIIKFLLECAPQYVFEKYGGTRIGPRGEFFRPGSHGAFYGGWLPCFTNPYVRKAAIKFVEKVTERYYNRKNIILWNVWNEIRNKPIEDCFCDHCRAAFGEYLRGKFGTIENLNDFYHTAEEDFETIALPAMAHGYWDIYEFKKFKGSTNLYENARFVYDAIRKYDQKRPIMCHVGVTGGFQTRISDVCDDYAVAKAVDFWGTSIPVSTDMSTHTHRLDYMMLQDYLRGIDENYFVHEIYPGLGVFFDYDTPSSMSYKLYTALSTGAKGLVYWQYRAERLGHENDCAGLVRMDGTPREVITAVKQFGDDLKQNMSYFVGAKVKKGDVAIIHDFNSQLMSEIEDGCKCNDYSFDATNPTLYYRKAHAGLYRLLRNANYNVDYLGVTNIEQIYNYKVVYFPYHTMLDRTIVPHLQKFMENGGVVIADEGFGMRQLNTWMQPYDIDCKPLMTARLRERRIIANEQIEVDGKRTKIAPFKSQYHVTNGETILNFADNTPAVQRVRYGKGSLYLFGFSVGYSYHETGDQVWEKQIENILSTAGVEKYAYADFENGIYEKRMVNGGKEILFISNYSGDEKHIQLDSDAVAYGGFVTVNNSVMTVPPNSIGYAVVNAQ